MAYQDRVTLVTGATGFIGSYVVQGLTGRGGTVLATSRYGWRPESRRVIRALPELLSLDLRDVDVVRQTLLERGVTEVIHLDAVVDPVGLRSDALRALHRNMVPTVHLLEACRDTTVGRFVLASSVSVLPSIQFEPISADHPLVTREGGPAGGFYGVAKAATEVFALGYRASFDIDVRIVRPSAVYGYGMQWPIGIKPVVEGLVRGEEVKMPRNGPPRDYTPVQDVAAILIAALECSHDDDVVFNAGTGAPLVTSEALRAAVRTVFPDGAIRVIDTDLDPTGVESRYRGVLDMGPVRSQLGVRPHFATLAEGLAAYAETYRRDVSG